ncbi:hypothetical protein BGZ73_007070 [Actinomortierella ambigua]|nr:hypothetical protein BGZ73_007070 [Actinomortierella ambigua]
MHGRLCLSTLLFVAAMTLTTAQKPTAPAPAAEVGYAKAKGKFYVYGGRTGPEANAVTGQFFELDLTKPWKADSPAWTELPAGPKQTRIFMAMSADGKNLIANAVQDCSAYQYSADTKTWITQEGSPWRCLSSMNPFLVTVDPTNTAFYVETDDTMSNTWISDYQFANDMSTGSWEIPPFGGIGGVDYLPSRGDYKAGWSKQLASVVFYGGTSLPSTASTAQWVSLYHPESDQWKSLKTSGANEKTSVDHCVAVSFDKNGKVADAGKASAPVLIYNIAQDKWVSDFEKSAGSSGGGGTSSESDAEPESPASNRTSSSSSNVGGIVGGIFGALAIIGAAFGFFWWRRKKQRQRRIYSTKYWYKGY